MTPSPARCPAARRWPAMALAPALVVCLATPLAPLRAHEGHDHGEPPAAELLPVLAPRAEATGDAVELLVVIDGGQLTLYLDRFDTNEPITGARIEVESGRFTGVASSLGDGVYRMPAAPLQQPGEHALVFTVQVGDQADLLETTLKVPPPDAAQATARAAAAAAGPAGWRAAVPVALGVLLGGVALWGVSTLVARGRRRPAPMPDPRPAPDGGSVA